MELDDKIQRRIDQQIASGRYKTANEVLDEAMSLLEEDACYGPQMTMAELEESLIEARKGKLIEYTPEYFEDLKRRCREQIKVKTEKREG